jgi:hypothetical protein
MDDAGRPGVRLTRTEDNVEAIDALAARHGGRVGLDGVLSGLDRRLRRTWAPGLAVHRAWTWDAADRRDPRWWPQGVSSSAAADVERRILAVSWYAQGGGSRISFLDLAARRYQHVDLVVATESGHEPLRVHAGGIAWHGPYLHVAATGKGFWTCHTDDVIETPSGFVLPVRFGYRAGADEGTERLRYSFLSLDTDASPPALVVGEYGSRSRTRRLAHFALDPDSLLLATDEEGVSHPEVVDGGVVRAQGVVRVGGTYYLTVSHGPWTPGSVYAGQPGAFRHHRWAAPMGPEDLAHEPGTDLLWTVTEHPRRRWVVAMRRSRLAPATGD